MSRPAPFIESAADLLKRKIPAPDLTTQEGRDEQIRHHVYQALSLSCHLQGEVALTREYLERFALQQALMHIDCLCDVIWDRSLGDAVYDWRTKDIEDGLRYVVNVLQQLRETGTFMEVSLHE